MRPANLSMQRDPKAWLWDVRDAGLAIQRFVHDQDLSSYAGSELIHSAVERKFEIIGEALNQLSKVRPELAAQIPNLSQVIAFRNQLIHGYARVDNETVWQVIHGSLKELLLVVSALMADLA